MMSELGNESVSEPLLDDSGVPQANTQSGIVDDNTEVESNGSNVGASSRTSDSYLISDDIVGRRNR